MKRLDWAETERLFGVKIDKDDFKFAAFQARKRVERAKGIDSEAPKPSKKQIALQARAKRVKIGVALKLKPSQRRPIQSESMPAVQPTRPSYMPLLLIGIAWVVLVGQAYFRYR